MADRLFRQLSMSLGTTVIVKIMIEKFYAEPKVVPVLKIFPPLHLDVSMVYGRKSTSLV